MKLRRQPKAISTVARAIVLAGGIAAAVSAEAQVPADIATQLRALGTGVCVPETAKIYKPLQQKAPYTGVTVVRDIAYVNDPRTIMDVFAPESCAGNRPVLIFVSGGARNKLEAAPDGDVFYDNIMLWAVKNGMTGVNMQRRGGLNGAGMAWDEPAKDVGVVVEWVRQNITKYKGNPDRIFLWSSSAGNGPVSTFAAHPEISGKNGDAVKGVILMSAPNFNILPETIAPAPRGSAPAAGGAPLGTNCGRAAGAGGPGRGAPTGPPGGGAPPARGARGGAPAEQPDQATQLARSNLAGLAKGKTEVLIMWGELDPPAIINFDQGLKDALCKTGRCPTAIGLKDHSHMSLVFSPNTADTSVTGPILKWMSGVK
jgi:triacylglycerol lipase